MVNKNPKEYKKMLENNHTLPYKVRIDNQRYDVIVYSMLGKITGIIVANENGLTVNRAIAQEVIEQVQKYSFYFDYLKKRTQLVKERDSITAERIEGVQRILNEKGLFGEKMQLEIDQLNLALEVYKQQQRKLDIYQEDIALLNEKIESQHEIYEEDWHHAEDLSLAYAIAAYGQSLYLEKTRDIRRKMLKWAQLHGKMLPPEPRKALTKLTFVLSEAQAGHIFEQIISLIPMLEIGLTLHKEQEIPARVKEFGKAYELHLRNYEPPMEQITPLIRNKQR
ncbi:hypothetical protein HB911_04660 [Listeria booriae]|uniref:hypothetical protein n=1 Tax=Listeria booriae TaxID=1552123 RepID=UPI001627F6C6|nr:hypothetical protein [Listeria booriae]MBC1557996.1 hypothetical protein [Listeria booriae]